MTQPVTPAHLAATARAYCEACSEPVTIRGGKARRYCDRHEWQIRAHGHVTAIERNASQVRGEHALSRRECVLEAVIALANADAEREEPYHAAWVRLTKIVDTWRGVRELKAQLRHHQARAEQLEQRLTSRAARSRRVPRYGQHASQMAQLSLFPAERAAAQPAVIVELVPKPRGRAPRYARREDMRQGARA